MLPVFLFFACLSFVFSSAFFLRAVYAAARSMLHEFMCKHWLPPPLTAVFIMLNFLGGDGESDDSLSEDAGVARRMFGWAGRMVETVTSRETQMHMASDADNGEATGCIFFVLFACGSSIGSS